MDWARLLHRPEISFARSLFDSAVRGKRVLVIGAGGSVGTALTRIVAAHEPECLLLLDSHEASLVHLRQSMAEDLGRRDAHFVLADVRDRAKVDQVFRRNRIDLVFHLAAYKQVPLSEDNVDQVAGVNLLGALNVVEAAMERGATLVYPSSDKAVTPLSVYAATKRIVERMLQSFAFTDPLAALRVVRLVNVFGTQGSVVERFARQIEAGLPLTITDPAMDRYWMTMAEATRLLLVAATRRLNEGIYLLDVGEPVGIGETARRVHALLRPDVGPPVIRETGIRPGERLHEALTFPEERIRPTELPGLLAIAAPAPTADAASWRDELARLRRCGYEWEPARLKAWLLDLAARG